MKGRSAGSRPQQRARAAGQPARRSARRDDRGKGAGMRAALVDAVKVDRGAGVSVATQGGRVAGVALVEADAITDSVRERSLPCADPHRSDDRQRATATATTGGQGCQLDQGQGAPGQAPAADSDGDDGRHRLDFDGACGGQGQGQGGPNDCSDGGRAGAGSEPSTHSRA